MLQTITFSISVNLMDDTWFVFAMGDSRAAEESWLWTELTQDEINYTSYGSKFWFIWELRDFRLQLGVRKKIIKEKLKAIWQDLCQGLLQLYGEILSMVRKNDPTSLLCQLMYYYGRSVEDSILDLYLDGILCIANDLKNVLGK